MNSPNSPYPKHSLANKIAPIAREAFKDHELEQTLDSGLFRSWRCRRPTSWAYGFDVTTSPGWLFIGGDIDHLALKREADMIAWGRRCFDRPQIDLHYVSSKAPQSLNRTAFNSDLIRPALEDYLDVTDERASLITEAEDECGCSTSWYTFLEDNVLDPEDLLSVMDYSPDLLWPIFGLRKFFELLIASGYDWSKY